MFVHTAIEMWKCTMSKCRVIGRSVGPFHVIEKEMPGPQDRSVQIRSGGRREKTSWSRCNISQRANEKSGERAGSRGREERDFGGSVYICRTYGWSGGGR